MNAPDSPMDRFWACARAMAQKTDRGNVSLYESLKRHFVDSFPAATPEQYTAAMQRIAKICGI